MAPIQEAFQANKEWQEIEKKAYPPPPEPEKKKKVKKDKGSKYPPKKVEAKPDGHVEGKDAEKISVGADGGEKAIENLTLEDKS
jgi:tyrosyl-tRNA synthetase